MDQLQYYAGNYSGDWDGIPEEYPLRIIRMSVINMATILPSYLAAFFFFQRTMLKLMRH